MVFVVSLHLLFSLVLSVKVGHFRNYVSLPDGWKSKKTQLFEDRGVSKLPHL